VLKAFLAMAFAACASGAAAPTVFVQGSVGTDVRRFSGEGGSSPFDGSSTAMAFAVGTELARHWVVSADVDLGGRSTSTTTTRAYARSPSHVADQHITRAVACADQAGMPRLIPSARATADRSLRS
jgi:hypothetical protein